MTQTRRGRGWIAIGVTIGLIGFIGIETGVAGEPWEGKPETAASILARSGDLNRPREVGRYYEARVPDTLDLAERARLGVNHFTSIISVAHDYEMFWRADFEASDMWAWPGRMWFQLSPLQACQPKAIEALAMERLMTGSGQHLEREGKMLQMMTGMLGDDGLYYVQPSQGKKPWLGGDETLPRANVHGQGRMLRAMIIWYQYTGNEQWKRHVDKMVDGMDRHLVVHRDDYAFVPTGGWIESNTYSRSSYTPRGWKTAEEPANEKKGEEGSLFNHQGHLPGALANWYMLTGNEQALRLSGRLVRFLTKPQFWADAENGEYPGVVGADHAHWRGHFHGHINALRAILEYAVAANDSRLKLFVRDGYEWSRQAGLARFGIMGDAQGCGLGRVIGLAIKLTDADVGDYWEDVDLYLRNQGTEAQLVPADIPHFQQMLTRHPDPTVPPDLVSYFDLRAKHPKGLPDGVKTERVVGTDDNMLHASIGSFTMSYPPFKTGWALCCSPHGNMGLFYAWEAALRYASGVARVNLLINRASPWLDIQSSLPYAGKVVLENKEAKEAFVRIPLWVDKQSVSCRVGTRKLNPMWFGAYLRITDLKAHDRVTIEFPMLERTETWTAPPQGQYLLPIKAETRFTCRFRGNTLTELTPPLLPGSWLYQDRAKNYQTSNVPTKSVIRYVVNQSLKW